MAKRSKKRKADRNNVSALSVDHEADSRQKSFRSIASSLGIPLLLAVLTFLAYWPSLYSDFLYDGREEILKEGFITSLSNLPDVLSLKVLSMNLLLGDRPGQLLYLMLIAAMCGKAPFGYHVACNLLHAANVALLYFLLRRLVTTEMPQVLEQDKIKVRVALVLVCLIFALHPLVVESVSAINYSSDLLVTFFTLLALLSATGFRANNRQSALTLGGAGVFCSLAAVSCKESGLAAALLLIVYWLVFRRQETREPWLWFLGTSVGVTVMFLAARFHLAPASALHPAYLGGSFSQVFLIQPQLWIFMMGKLVWPIHLSADYTLENLNGLTTPLCLIILAAILFLQGALALKSRIGALGVAIFWLGLLTVSNFVPLFRIEADRFYYLPLAGVALQIMGALLLILNSPWKFATALIILAVDVIPFTALNLARQKIFSNEFALWADTVKVSPFSYVAHANLGLALSDQGRYEEAISECQKSLAIDPQNADALNNLGIAYFHTGQPDAAITEYQKALEIKPDFVEVYYNLGNVFLQNEQLDEAIRHYQKALELKPDMVQAHSNLGIALYKSGQMDAGIAEFQKALSIDPTYTEAQTNLAHALSFKEKANNSLDRLRDMLRHNQSPQAPSHP